MMLQYAIILLTVNIKLLNYDKYNSKVRPIKIKKVSHHNIIN